MKVMRRRSSSRGFADHRGAGGFFAGKPSFSESGLLLAAELVYFLLIISPEYLGINMHIILMIAMRAAISLTALPAMWHPNSSEFAVCTRILVTAEVVLLWLELIPGCLRPAMLLHLIVFFGITAAMFITTNFFTISKTEFLTYITPGLRLCGISAIRLNPDEGGNAYFIAVVVLAILCGIISVIALIRSGRINKILCVCCGPAVALFSFFIFFCSVMLVNYSLDFSEPEHHSVVLEDFDINYRAPNAFIVTINGKQTELTAPAALHLRYDKGDTLSVLEYNGPLGITYYMIEGLK